MNFKRALLKLHYDKIFYRSTRQHNKIKFFIESLFYKKICYLFYVIFHTTQSNTLQHRTNKLLPLENL